MGLLSRFFKNNNEEEQQGSAPPEILPQRNDLCWCNSGLKYKKCHLEQDRIFLEKRRRKVLESRNACTSYFGG